jgi:hypothetical protein
MEYIPSSVSGSAGFTIDGCSRAYRCSDETMQGLVDHIHYPTRVMADKKRNSRPTSAAWERFSGVCAMKVACITWIDAQDWVLG